MHSKDNGGPAFPKQNPHGGYEGMTLRDYFAGQALVGITTLPGAADSIQELAEAAYIVADAMLKEREKAE